MFLYARIILDGLESMNTLDEVKRHLEVLPASLHEAYVVSGIHPLANEARTS